MSHIDIIYHKLLRTINISGKKVFDKSRKIDTVTIPSYQLEITPRPDDFPLITTKKVDFKSIVVELLFFLKGYSNIQYLINNGCNIWNKDAYNYYLSKSREDTNEVLNFEEFVKYLKDPDSLEPLYLPLKYTLGDLGPVYGVQWNRGQQLVNVIRKLVDKDFDRRLIVNAWNPEELNDMALPPCHWSFELLPIDDILTIKWHQRSVDTFLGLPFNIGSYWLLMDILCDLADLIPGKLIGDLSNVHIYNNHKEAVKTQLSNSVYTHSAPKLDKSKEYYSLIMEFWQDRLSIKEFIHLLTPDMFSLVNYNSFPRIKAEMLAPKL